MTKDGLLYVKDSEGQREKGTHTQKLKKKKPTGEWIFPASKGKGDYHAQMNNQRYLDLVE